MDHEMGVIADPTVSFSNRALGLISGNISPMEEELTLMQHALPQMIAQTERGHLAEETTCKDSKEEARVNMEEEMSPYEVHIDSPTPYAISEGVKKGGQTIDIPPKGAKKGAKKFDLWDDMKSDELDFDPTASQIPTYVPPSLRPSNPLAGNSWRVIPGLDEPKMTKFADPPPFSPSYKQRPTPPKLVTQKKKEK